MSYYSVIFFAVLLLLAHNQKIFSRGIASIKSTASYISQTFLFLQKYYKSISELPISKMN